MVKTVNLLTPDSTPNEKAHQPVSPIPQSLKVDLFNDQSTGAEETSKVELEMGETIYSKGKAMFQRGSKIRNVVGRKNERKCLLERISNCMKTRTSGALYVSGLPGTGKSALVSELLNRKDIHGDRTTEIAQINCMTIDKADQTYGVIAKEFGFLERRSNKTKAQAIEILHAEFQLKHKTHILVLDELDRIVTADQEVLFKIFEWACGTTNLLVIGIANAIDLTDRFLPRLQAHKLKPEVIAFKPYTAQGITEIIENRLSQLEKPLMNAAAVRICAAKTAANSGDLRKAFDICRRAIEMVEEEEATRDPSTAELKQVTTAHVAKVCQVAFGGVDARKRLQILNFQQRAVLCVLMKTERSSTVPNITVVQAFQEYEERCSHNPLIKSLSYAEYMEVVNALESIGLVAVTGLCGKKGLGSHGSIRLSRGGGGASGSKGNEGYRDEFGFRKISSRAQVLDVIQDLSDNDPLKAILMD